MSQDDSLLKRLIITLAYYVILFPLTYFILLHFRLIDPFQESMLFYFDAENYFKIAQSGYFDSWLTAYFPLFPSLWSVISGAAKISVINGLLYILAVSLLSWKFNVSRYTHLVYLSLPSVLFFFLPYSEALFFVSSVILLFGLRERVYWLVILGSFLAATCRPTIAVFIPAFWLVSVLELLTTKNKFDWKTPSFGTLSSLLGLAVVFFIQWLYTGEFFTFLEAQKLWGNELGLPSFPFSSWGGNNIVRLDAIAFWAGVSSGIAFLLATFKRKMKLPREASFSLLYLGGTTLLILIYRGGDFFSLNRFIFATPFFLVVLDWLARYKKVSKWWLLPVSLLICSLLFGAYVHIQALLKWLLLVVFISFLVLSIPLEQLKPKLLFRPLVLLLMIALQVYFLWRFFEGLWIA